MSWNKLRGYAQDAEKSSVEFLNTAVSRFTSMYQQRAIPVFQTSFNNCIKQTQAAHKLRSNVMEPIAGSVCRACRVRIAQQSRGRTFSTSTSRRSVPPESPHYVDVPSSFQPLQPYYPTPKGTLPVPREIFPANRPEKATLEYVQNVTKDPKPENIVPDSELTTTQSYKSRMSALRRTQLREALTSLHARKQAEISFMSRRSEAKQTQRSLLLSQAEREDARLTNVSTPKNMQPGQHSSVEALQADVEVARRQHETKLANVAAHAEARQAMKMDALHSLYMNAREFITTEEQLDRLVKQQFDTTPDPDGVPRHAEFKSDFAIGTSMWSYGPPENIGEKVGSGGGKVGTRRSLINQISGSMGARDRLSQELDGRKKMDSAKFAKDQERFKRIAEKLSGGKI